MKRCSAENPGELRIQWCGRKSRQKRKISRNAGANAGPTRHKRQAGETQNAGGCGAYQTHVVETNETEAES